MCPAFQRYRQKLLTHLSYDVTGKSDEYRVSERTQSTYYKGFCGIRYPGTRAHLPDAETRGYNLGRFFFTNVSGGRCGRHQRKSGYNKKNVNNGFILSDVWVSVKICV